MVISGWQRELTVAGYPSVVTCTMTLSERRCASSIKTLSGVENEEICLYFGWNFCSFVSKGLGGACSFMLLHFVVVSLPGNTSTKHLHGSNVSRWVVNVLFDTIENSSFSCSGSWDLLDFHEQPSQRCYAHCQQPTLVCMRDHNQRLYGQSFPYVTLPHPAHLMSVSSRQPKHLHTRLCTAHWHILAMSQLVMSVACH